MSVRTKVSDSLSDNWRDFLIVLATVCGVVALLLFVKGWLGAELAALGFVLSLVLLGLEQLARFRNRRFVTVAPDGFTLHDRRGERVISDDQVVCLSLRREPRYMGEVLLGWTRIFHVWIDRGGPTELVRMVNFVSASEGDPLQLLIERLHQQMLEQARQTLAAGEAFSGDGWSLTADEFLISRGRDVRAMRLRELAPVSVIDRAVCVWRRGEDEPIARISLDTANAAVLVDLLNERVKGDEETVAVREPDREGMGRLLFERRPTLQTKEAVALLGGVLLFLAGLIVSYVAMERITLRYAVAGTAVLAIFCLFWCSVLGRCVALRCYEHGVWSRRLLREACLRYTEIEAFRWACVRQYVNGGYLQTTLSVEFVPRASSGKRAVRYKTVFQHGDAELDALCEHISGVVAARMLQELGAGQPVQWTPGARFLPHGIEVLVRREWSWRREPLLVPYAELAGAELQAGCLGVWKRGQATPFLTQRSDAPNFFPGYKLLMSCFREREPEPEPETAAV